MPTFYFLPAGFVGLAGVFGAGLTGAFGAGFWFAICFSPTFLSHLTHNQMVM
jgi:hypothetical protein